MSYDLRESNETSGLHAWLKSTKFAFFRRFWSGGRVNIALGRVTYFEALFLTMADKCWAVKRALRSSFNV